MKTNYFMSDEFHKDAIKSVRAAIAEDHAAGRTTCHGDGQGDYLLFPDQSKRYFADNLPDTWLHIWADFQRKLYDQVPREIWPDLVLSYRAEHGRFIAEVPNNISPPIAAQVRVLAAQYAKEDPAKYPKEGVFD
jgi:hypothetical protein